MDKLFNPEKFKKGVKKLILGILLFLSFFLVFTLLEFGLINSTFYYVVPCLLIIGGICIVFGIIQMLVGKYPKLTIKYLKQKLSSAQKNIQKYEKIISTWNEKSNSRAKWYKEQISLLYAKEILLTHKLKRITGTARTSANGELLDWARIYDDDKGSLGYLSLRNNIITFTSDDFQLVLESKDIENASNGGNDNFFFIFTKYGRIFKFRVKDPKYWIKQINAMLN